MCDFLLVFCCNNVQIFYLFLVITIYLSEICVFSPFLPTTASYEAFTRGSPGIYSIEVGNNKKLDFLTDRITKVPTFVALKDRTRLPTVIVDGHLT